MAPRGPRGSLAACQQLWRSRGVPPSSRDRSGGTWHPQGVPSLVPERGCPRGGAGAPFLPPVLQALTRLQLLPLEPAHPHPPPPRPPQRPLRCPGQRWGQCPQVTRQLLPAPVSLRDHPCARGGPKTHPTPVPGLLDGHGHEGSSRGVQPPGCPGVPPPPLPSPCAVPSPLHAAPAAAPGPAEPRSPRPG